MTQRRALITGITGQDGSYLADFLLSKGYHITGMIRRSSGETGARIVHIREQLDLRQGDLCDQGSLIRLIAETMPDEVYNLAAQSFVPTSWEQPILTSDVTGLGVCRILEAIRTVNPRIRFYQASSSEMFGQVRESPQTEGTPFHPRSPYGVAKVYGHQITVNYRESYGIFACSGILFNHESPRRGAEFISRKITHAASRIAAGLQHTLTLGNLDAQRDWGYAGDYVEAMWLMLQQDQPEDYVIATGIMHTVRDLVEAAFMSVGLEYQDHVFIDTSLLRPAEVHHLCGDASKAQCQLGWQPMTTFAELIAMMVKTDCAAASLQ